MTNVARTMSTAAFAEQLGGQIADQRHKRTIAEVFTAVMGERLPSASSEQVAVWADDIAALIVADTRLDSEELMAQRSVFTVLHKNFGSEITVFGAQKRSDA
jgi:hypothetical protein